MTMSRSPVLKPHPYQETYLLQNILSQMSDDERTYAIVNILNTITDGVMITDANDIIVLVNRNHVLMEFLDHEDMLGHSVYELMEKGHCKKLTAFDGKEMKRLIKPGSLKMSTRTGKEIIVTGLPLVDHSNQIKLIIYTSRDITEFEKLRNDLEKESALRVHYEEQLNNLNNKKLLFSSKSMETVYHTVLKVSQADSSVFLMGESGVGKDIIAREIHDLSSRRNKPFIHVNCAAIPETLLESELFGYRGGAFTGALSEGKPGLLELAADGTLYLDEISETPISMQAKLLQVLQNNIFRRLGGIDDLQFKARVIASSNRNVVQLMEQERFRSDLYYRLCVVPIVIPPLRERREDILLLAESFLKRLNKKYRKERYFSPKLRDFIANHSWPGNVRELENYIERLYIITDSDCINVENIPLIDMGHIINITFQSEATLKEVDEKVEKVFLARALTKHENTRSAADALGISQATLLRKAHKYGIAVSDR